MAELDIKDLPGDIDTGKVMFLKETKMDPSQFGGTMKNLLLALTQEKDDEKYVAIFRQHNIGQSTLAVLTEDDLIKLDVDDPEIRKKILHTIKILPIKEESSIQEFSETCQLSLKEITDILTESTHHLNRICMSLVSTTKALSKEGVSDTLLYEDKYASDVAMTTLNEITNIFNSMENVLQNKTMVPTEGSIRKKKMIVGTIGSVVIITLAVLFARSLKQLK